MRMRILEVCYTLKMSFAQQGSLLHSEKTDNDFFLKYHKVEKIGGKYGNRKEDGYGAVRGGYQGETGTAGTV